MPSEDLDARILEALAGPLNAFRSALASTVEQVRGFLGAQRGRSESGNGAAALGRFAAGRIDTDRFTSLFEQANALDSATLERMEAVHERLSALAAEGEALYRVRVAPGGSLGAAVGEALARLGRVFGAARVFEFSRTGRYVDADHAPLLESLPYARWSRVEREAAPPLVVHAEGAALRAEALAEFLDGAQKFVLVAEGEAPLAPLARLITPGVFVLQTDGAAGLDRLAAWPGPGVAAVLEGEAARFVHDPGAGKASWERLEVQHLPAPAPGAGRSRAQQKEELAHLEALAAAPASAPAAPASDAAPAAAAPADPADKLAAWLLGQADLKGL